MGYGVECGFSESSAGTRVSMIEARKKTPQKASRLRTTDGSRNRRGVGFEANPVGFAFA